MHQMQRQFKKTSFFHNDIKVNSRIRFLPQHKPFLDNGRISI
jgi:hypothetical protein